MTTEAIAAAEREAKRFLEAVKAAKKRIDEDRYALAGSRETGALRRASLDLTRALADMRKPRFQQ